MQLEVGEFVQLKWSPLYGITWCEEFCRRWYEVTWVGTGYDRIRFRFRCVTTFRKGEAVNDDVLYRLRDQCQIVRQEMEEKIEVEKSCRIWHRLGSPLTATTYFSKRDRR